MAKNIPSMPPESEKAGQGTVAARQTQESEIQAEMRKSGQRLTAKKRQEKRASLPKERFMNYDHPLEFIQDVEIFHRTFKRQVQGVVSKGEFNELAWYTLRQELTGEAIPDWVVKIDGLGR